MRRTSGTWARSVVLLIAAWSGSVASEVTLDGSLGGARGPLPGPDFEIGADFGRRVGSNLFHSFGAFNLGASESATFSGPNAIENVLGRVTGGSGSKIDGLLRSTIPDANLFLLNPAGIVFGPSASLDVQGSFHGSTGDFIRLADGTRFDAVPSANDALLTTAPPLAFGFLGRQNPAPIEVNGSLLKVPDGKALSLIGGDIQVRGAQLIAPAGPINLASVGAKAEVTLGSKHLGTKSSARLGNIAMTEGSTIDVSEADGSVTGAGAVFIRGGQFVMDNSHIFSNTQSGNSQDSNIRLTDDLVMRNGSSIEASTSGPGKGGDLTVKAGRLQLTGGALIGTRTLGPGHGGRLQVGAEDILLEGEAPDVFSSLFSNTEGTDPDSGDAGDLTVKAGRLELKENAFIDTRTFGPGHGGNLTAEAEDILLGGESRNVFSGLFSGTEGTDPGSGDAGNIQRFSFEWRDYLRLLPAYMLSFSYSSLHSDAKRCNGQSRPPRAQGRYY